MNRRQFIASCAAAASAATMPGCALRPRCDRLFWYNASSGLHIPCEGLERPLRVWQVSDSHLNLRDSRDDEYKDFYARMGGEWNPGLTAREAFERILEKAKGERPDLLLVTGDLISFPTLKNVEFAVERLDACGVPWLYTAGNHDWHFEGDSGSDAEQRERWIEKRLLPLYKGEDPMAYAKTIGGVKFLMIDNSTYNVDERQLEFFRAETAKGGPRVLAMHIPFWHRGWGCLPAPAPTGGRIPTSTGRSSGGNAGPNARMTPLSSSGVRRTRRKASLRCSRGISTSSTWCRTADSRTRRRRSPP